MIQLRGVTKKYKNQYALKNINLDIMAGEFVFLTGASGAGKSTLMKILSGVYKKDNGEIYYNGKLTDIKGTNPCIYVSEYISDRKCEKVKLKLNQLGIKYHTCDIYQKTYNNMYMLTWG